MANSGDDHPLKFIWKIENFSGIKSGTLESPHFPWYSTTWEIIIHFPDETQDNESFSVELHQLQVKCEYFTCSFALLDTQGYPLVWKQKCCYSDESAHYICDLITGSELLGAKIYEFLPNGILTFQCHIWIKTDPFIEPVQLMALTQIALPVTEKSFTWEIADVMSRTFLNIVETEPHHEEPIMIVDNSSFGRIKMHFYSLGDDKLGLYLSFGNFYLKVRIAVLDFSGRRIELLNSKELPPGIHYLEFLDAYMLRCYRSSFVCNDALTLHFSLTGMLPGKIYFNNLVDNDKMFRSVPSSVNVSRGSTRYFDESKIEKPIRSHNSDTLSKTFQGMYEEGFLSDFCLKVGDRLFPVHKAVLGMRSAVFRAMFTAEMKEKEDSCSVIEDVDGETLHRMLQFIYSDHLEGDMDWGSTSSLYEAADKYDLQVLKRRCSTILKSGLCADSVLDVLALADLHRDQELKSLAFEFISLDDNEIVGSERWNKFEEENKELAFETLRSVHLHFKNRNKKLCVRGAQGTS